MGIFEGSVGIIISLNTGVDLAGATAIEIHVLRPDGTRVTWNATAVPEADPAPAIPVGCITYTSQADDLIQAGNYVLQAYIEWGNDAKHLGEATILEVSPLPPSWSKLGAVRLELGKGQSDDILTDSDIAYYLSRANDNVLLAASFCAESLAGYYAGLVDKSMGGSSVSLSQKAEAWRKKAAALKTMAMSPSITPRASSSTPRTLKFSVGQHDNIGYSSTGTW